MSDIVRLYELKESVEKGVPWLTRINQNLERIIHILDNMDDTLSELNERK